MNNHHDQLKRLKVKQVGVRGLSHQLKKKHSKFSTISSRFGNTLIGTKLKAQTKNLETRLETLQRLAGCHQAPAFPSLHSKHFVCRYLLDGPRRRP